MIKAWVLYFDQADNEFHFQELDGQSYDNQDPTSWGLHKSCSIMLVLHNAQFIQAWLYGTEVKR